MVRDVFNAFFVDIYYFMMCNVILYFQVPRNISVSLSTGVIFSILVTPNSDCIGGGTIDPKKCHPNGNIPKVSFADAIRDLF